MLRVTAQLFTPESRLANSGKPLLRYLSDGTTENIALDKDVKASAHTIELAIDSSTYELTAKLKDADGNLISTSNVIDLPIESMIINASYSNGVLTLTLQNGQTIEVDISDIISGLVNDVIVNGVSVVNSNGEAILTVDTTPTANSENLVTSGGVYAALGNYVTLSTDQTISGKKSFTADKTYAKRLEITSTNDVGGNTDTTETAPLLIGSKTGQHLELDGNEIVSKSNKTTPSGLFLQVDGGDTVLGNGIAWTQLDSKVNALKVRGNIWNYGATCSRGVDAGTNYEGYFRIATATIPGWYRGAKALIYVQDLDSADWCILQVMPWVAGDGNASASRIIVTAGEATGDFRNKFFLVVRQKKTVNSGTKYFELWYRQNATYQRITATFLTEIADTRNADPVGQKWVKYTRTSSVDQGYVTTGTVDLTNGYIPTASWGTSVFTTTDYPDVSIYSENGQVQYIGQWFGAKNTQNAYSDTPDSASNRAVYFYDKNYTDIAGINATVGKSWNALNFYLRSKSNATRNLELVHYPSTDTWNFDCTTDNSVNLGTATRRWKNLYLAGIISDGTNYENVTNIIKKVKSVSNPNLLCNSNFAINQRGGLSYGNSLNSWRYTVDRWRLSGGFSSQSYDLTTNTVTLSSGSFEQIIDIPLQFAGKTVTASFNASNVSGNLSLQIYDGFNTYSQTLVSGTTTLTATLSDNIASVVVGQLPTIRVMVYGTGSFSPNWAKLEVGAIATEYIPPIQDEEFERCRFYLKKFTQVQSPAIATTTSTTECRVPLGFLGVMRTVPTVSFYNCGIYAGDPLYWTQENFASAYVEGFDYGYYGFTGGTLIATLTNAVSAWTKYMMRIETDGYIIFDAENYNDY